ncbi:cell division protein FtsL [Vulgatibacter incomptus]|uniref:Cell division protein FtsL n=1 Tax=Vulgatibacter incomptus TaxID=1391653 RepID=A0A0K1PEC6_9BACT|nr:cell division protein FtsL [Vulgatibacter incomptus]AKU91870.1 hypothetical protein AKJ08_2257 [Vulgatibacter incomptus]
MSAHSAHDAVLPAPRGSHRGASRPKRSRKLRGAVETRGVLADLLVFAVLCVVASIFAWTRIEGTMAGYDLSRVQAEHSDLLREQNALRIELATRKGAKRIEANARGKLGMVEPAPDRIVPIPGAAR